MKMIGFAENVDQEAVREARVEKPCKRMSLRHNLGNHECGTKNSGKSGHVKLVLSTVQEF